MAKSNPLLVRVLDSTSNWVELDPSGDIYEQMQELRKLELLNLGCTDKDVEDMSEVYIQVVRKLDNLIKSAEK